MKKNTLLAVLLLLTSAVTAQSTKIELLDLVKMFSPDSAAVSNVITWPATNVKASTIKWKNAVPKKEGKNYVKTGTAAILLKGKPVQCSGVNSDAAPCKWGVVLTGTKTSVASLTVAADNLHIENDIDMIDYFFGSNKLKAVLIEKDTESILYWNYKYKLQLAGKKDIWMRITYENQTATATQAENNNYTDLFYIDFFTSKKDMDAQ